MNKTLSSLIAGLIHILILGCASSNPVSSSHNEAVDHIITINTHDTVRDIRFWSIYEKDSMAMRISNDTVYIDRWHTYREKIQNENTIKSLQSVIDSLNAVTADTIYVPRPKEKAENRLTSWQSFQIWIGRLVLIAVLLYIVFLYLKRKLPFFS